MYRRDTFHPHNDPLADTHRAEQCRDLDWQIDLAALSTNSLHKIAEGADHASFWLDAETAKVSIAAILQVLDAAAPARH